MNSEERQMLSDLFERIRANASAARDPQAEAFIGDAVRAVPFAPYVLAQTVLVQQQALEGAARRVTELQAQVESLSRQQPQAPAEETSFLGGLGRSLFGGGSSAPPPSAPPPRPSGYDASAYQRSGGQAPPQPSYAPQQPSYSQQPTYAPPPPQAGPWGAPSAPAGGGFLAGAMKTAAGVAGGVVLGNALGGLFGGHSGGGMFGGGAGLGGMGMGGMDSGVHETVNNYYESSPDSGGQSQDGFLDADDTDDGQYVDDNDSTTDV